MQGGAQMEAAAAPSLHQGQPILWKPHPGPQTRFVTTRCHEVLYGGQAGGGKSAGLIAMPLRWVRHPHFSALILRRDTTQLGNLLKKAEAIYPTRRFRGKPKIVGSSVIWKFPSGAQVWFTHCENEKDVGRFDGDEFQLVEFDELTHFTEKQYLGIKARLRGPWRDLPRYARSTTNPGGVGHAWVFSRFGAWLDPDYKIDGLPKGNGKAPPAQPGQVLWFLTENGIERVVPEGTVGADGAPALSRTFVPARLADNPSVAQNDPQYLAALNELDPVRRAQLKDGNWLVSYSAGSLFQRSWFDIVESVHGQPLVRARIWDRAATKPSAENKDPDWTRGLLLCRTRDGVFYVEDLVSLRDRPAQVDALMRNTAELDGRQVQIIIFQDPGSAGVAEADATVAQMAGWPVKVVKVGKSDGDKVTRAKPASAQAERRNIRLLRGAWNKPFLDEVEAFPTQGVHDDIVDTLSTGISELGPTSAAARFVMLAQQ